MMKYSFPIDLNAIQFRVFFIYTIDMGMRLTIQYSSVR